MTLDAQDVRREALRNLIANEYGGVVRQFAKAAGKPDGQINDMLSDPPRKSFGEKVARGLEAAVGLPSGFLDAPRCGQPQELSEPQQQSTLVDLTNHPDLVAVPRVKFKLSAGVSGFAIEAENGNGKPVFFRKDWFKSKGYKPAKLFSVRVCGASMEPALWDGDLVVINTDDTTPKDGEAFAMNYEGELVIKRLRRDAGEWWAASDNADQRRFAPKRCTADVKVIGRVVYKQSEQI